MSHPLPSGCSGGARVGETQNTGRMQHLAVPGAKFGGAERKLRCREKRPLLSAAETLGAGASGAVGLLGFHTAKQQSFSALIYPCSVGKRVFPEDTLPDLCLQSRNELWDASVRDTRLHLLISKTHKRESQLPVRNSAHAFPYLVSGEHKPGASTRNVARFQFVSVICFPVGQENL